MERAFGLEIPLALAEVCHAQRTALIVYDCNWVSCLPMATGWKNVSVACSKPRYGGYRLLHTPYVPSEAGRWSHPIANGDGLAARGPCRPGQAGISAGYPGFQIAPEIAPLPSEGVIDKITMSAFAGTFLDIAFRDCGINSFVIVGIALEVGIEPTVRTGWI